MEDLFCYGCQSFNTPIVYDHISGHTICSVCGLILDSRSSHESNNYEVLCATDGPSNPTIPAANRGSNGGGTTLLSYGSLRNHPHGSDPNSPMTRALIALEDMARKSGMVERIKNQAKELYKKVDDEKICGRQRNPRAIVAACLYLVCQQEGFPRTFREIYNLSGSVRIKEIHKCIEILKKRFELTGTIHVKDIAWRYCSDLGLNNHILRAVQEAVQRTESYDIRRNSTSIVAATIFMVTQLSEKSTSIREVAQASEVAEGTIRNAYKDLYHYASLLIPNWYANANDIKRLRLL